jgi:hypothetical protein
MIHVATCNYHGNKLKDNSVTDSNISSNSYGDFLIKLSKQSNGLTVLEMIKIRNSIENTKHVCTGLVILRETYGKHFKPVGI